MSASPLTCGAQWHKIPTSLTAHYITPDFEHQQVCLHAAPFNKRHTGEHIVTMLTKCLENWNLAEKLHVVVRDNGSNFVAGL